MYLYQDKSEIPDNCSKGKYNLTKVISKFLEKIRDIAIEELKSKRLSFQSINARELIEKIKWILSVPAIWSDKSKTCMLEAAKLAKLIKEEDDPSNFFCFGTRSCCLLLRKVR